MTSASLHSSSSCPRRSLKLQSQGRFPHLLPLSALGSRLQHPQLLLLLLLLCQLRLLSSLPHPQPLSTPFFLLRTLSQLPPFPLCPVYLPHLSPFTSTSASSPSNHLTFIPPLWVPQGPRTPLSVASTADYPLVPLFSPIRELPCGQYCILFDFGYQCLAWSPDTVSTQYFFIELN